MMARRFKIRAFAGGFLLVLFLWLLLGCGKDGVCPVNAQGADAGKVYVDRKERDVVAIAKTATINNGNCQSLNGCNSACSRVTCHPTRGESPVCSAVDNNEFHDTCPAGACRNRMMLNYNRSFVILPAPGSLSLGTEVARDICLQRPLESTFKDASSQSEFTFVYFGSTSGPFRVFPGREQNETQCTTFDTRKRPWYLNAVSVAKNVKLLVDVSNSMSAPLPVYFKFRQLAGVNTYLDLAKNITLELMQTFLAGDFVEVFSFDSTSAVSLGGRAVQINGSYDSLNPGDRPELAALRASVGNLTPSPNAASSDLNGALTRAVDSFNITNQLKVIMVLSDGLFAPLNSTTFPSADLKKLKVKLMVYKLPTNKEAGDPYLKNTSLEQNLCSVNGSFERLNASDTANSLYAMRSYFSFLAGIQLASVGNIPTWSPLYKDALQGLYASTVTYPAFGSDKELIGVAGVDVFLDDLPQPLRDLVRVELQNRKSSTQDPPANISFLCNYQGPESARASSICEPSTPLDSSVICPRTSTRSLADRVCCGFGTCGPVGGRSKGLKTWVIAVITIGAGVLAAAGIIGCWCKIWGESRRETGPFPNFPEPESDTAS